MKSNQNRRAQEARIRAMYVKLQMRRPPRQSGEPVDLDAEENLLRYLVAIDEEPSTTYAQQLIGDGIELPAPDSLPADSVAEKLWEVINGLARRHAFLTSTDHLSDLDLYRHLWEKILNMTADGFEPDMTNCASMIDLLDDIDEDTLFLRCRYYKDELAREFWAEEFPDRPIPQPIEPPYRRDGHLPKPCFQLSPPGQNRA